MSTMTSIFVPVVYVVLVFGGLWIFSSWYRKRNADRIYEPYFKQHRERDLYITLSKKKDPAPPQTLLKAALVRRAMTDVARLIRLREDKPALQQLLQKGSIGDDLWNSLLGAEKELEAELADVATEANNYVEGWGQVIFTTASEALANERMRATLERVPAMRAERGHKYGRVAASKAVESSTPALPAAAMAVPISVSKSPVPHEAVSTSGNLAPSSMTTENIASDSEGPNNSASSRSPSKSGKKAKKRK